MVNEAFVRRYLDGTDPLGRRVGIRGRKYTIAGVVRDSLYNAFGEPPTPILYFSLRDRPALSTEMHLRTRAGSETTIASDVRRVVRELDPELPVYDIRTLSDHIEANLIFRRIPARMFMVLGPLLLLLAAIGISTFVVSFFHTAEAAGAASSAVAITLSILGGTFAPTATAPDLMARVALLTPHAWFLRGLGEMAGPGGSVADCLPAVGVLLLMGLVPGVIGVARSRRLVTVG